MRHFRASVGVAVFAVCTMSGCLSSTGALPPVRWFDPLPARAADAAVADVAVRVVAPPHLGREFVVRVGPHEVAIDGEHQWVDEPARLVGIVLARALPAGTTPGAAVEAALEVFEFDVTAGPRAHVRVVFGRERPAGTPAVADVSVAAADRSPAALASAMAEALAQLETQVRSH
jgi:hypothetical protein